MHLFLLFHKGSCTNTSMSTTLYWDPWAKRGTKKWGKLSSRRNRIFDLFPCTYIYTLSTIITLLASRPSSPFLQNRLAYLLQTQHCVLSYLLRLARPQQSLHTFPQGRPADGWSFHLQVLQVHVQEASPHPADGAAGKAVQWRSFVCVCIYIYIYINIYTCFLTGRPFFADTPKQNPQL